MTSTETRTWQIIDLSDGEVAGTAPGTDQRTALSCFNRDALDGTGRLEPLGLPADQAHRWELVHEGNRYGAQIETSALQPGANARAIMDADRAPADLENGPSADEEPSALERVDAITDQLHDARRELEAAKARQEIAAGDYVRGAGSEDAIRDYALEAARAARHVRELETELADAKRAAIEHEPAHPAHVRFDLIDEENAKRGLPCTLEEADDLGFATVLWDKATYALDQDPATDHEPTNREVAQRVAAAYATIWMGA